MARPSHHWFLAWLLGAAAGLGPSLLRAEYIICYEPKTFLVRISCEAACRDGEWLWASHEEAWLGCGTQGPDCGSSWGEWGHYTAVGPDPCPEGCWRTQTLDNEFRILAEGAKQQRDLWQCQGIRAAG